MIRRRPPAETAPAAHRAGMAASDQPHVPVLLDEVVESLKLDGGLAVDGTFGAGGYTRALLAADPTLRVIGIDRDPTAIADGQPLVAEAGGRLRLVPGRFGDLDALLSEAGEPRADRVVLDIGVSSMQIDTPERGFSFRNDGPLDMRMGNDGPSAADLVNEADETVLADIIYRAPGGPGGARYRRLVDADRYTGAGFLVPQRRPPRHAHGQ